jgi:hypothetical protein
MQEDRGYKGGDRHVAKALGRVVALVVGVTGALESSYYKSAINDSVKGQLSDNIEGTLYVGQQTCAVTLGEKVISEIGLHAIVNPSGQIPGE